MTFLSSWGLTGSLERSSFSALYFTQKRRGRGPMTNAAAFFPKCAPSFDFGVLWPNHSTFLQNFWNFKISLLLSKSRLLHTGRESINWLKKDMSKYYILLSQKEHRSTTETNAEKFESSQIYRALYNINSYSKAILIGQFDFKIFKATGSCIQVSCIKSKQIYKLQKIKSKVNFSIRGQKRKKKIQK